MVNYLTPYNRHMLILDIHDKFYFLNSIDENKLFDDNDIDNYNNNDIILIIEDLPSLELFTKWFLTTNPLPLSPFILSIKNEKYFTYVSHIYKLFYHYTF